MTPAQQQAIDSLRDEGYLVIIWTPQELGDIDSGHLEDSLIERGNDMIETLRQDVATDETRSYGPQGETA
jgi:hypothetical protein